MSVAPDNITQVSARARVRRMFEDRAHDLDRFSLPELVNDVLEAVKADTVLLDALVEECIRPMIYDLGLGVISSQRARRGRAANVQQAIVADITARTEPSPIRPTPLLGDRSKPSARSGVNWLRHPVAVAPGVTVRLQAAMRTDLAQAIEYGQQGAESIRVNLAYYEFVQDGLTSDTETVADRYQPAQLQALWQRAERRIAIENQVTREVKEKIMAQQQAAVASR